MEVIKKEVEMYFSKRKMKSHANKIVSGKYMVYSIRLSAGFVSGDFLSEFVDTMFVAWRKIVCTRNRSYIRNFCGILRRFFIDYDEESRQYEPYFYLICTREQKIAIESERYKIQFEEEKLRIATYVKWLSAWVSALKLCTDVSVGFTVLDLEGLEKSLAEFCTNEKYSVLAIIDEMKKELLKRACGNHKLVSYHGIFHDRHMSVGR